jgi:hypothetical protein
MLLPLQDSLQRAFSKRSDNRHVLDLDLTEDGVVGRVVYVVARAGVHGVLYPVKTDVQLTG